MSSPNLDNLNYIVGQHTQTLVKQDVQITALDRYVIRDTNRVDARQRYLKKLLLYKAKQRFVEKVNNYIMTLYDVHGNDFEITTLSPVMQEDKTPAWVLADMVMSQTDDREKVAFVDIFKYVYEMEPSIFFI
jgi:hypothetical protein